MERRGPSRPAPRFSVLARAQPFCLVAYGVDAGFLSGAPELRATRARRFLRLGLAPGQGQASQIRLSRCAHRGICPSTEHPRVTSNFSSSTGAQTADSRRRPSIAPIESDQRSLKSPAMPLRETIRVAVIQTTLDNACAWNDPTRLKISIAEENRAISEIGRGFTDLHQNQLAPDIVLLPELAVPRGYVDELARLANSLGALVIAGVDYSPPTRLKSVMNE